MNKKLFLAFLMFTFTFLLFSKIGYSQCTGSNPYPGGNWIVTGPTSCRNENFAVNGNVSVNSGGELYLSNTTIRINGTADGNFFNVNSGGYLMVNESSNLTTENSTNYWLFNLGDRSNITNSNISYAYQVNVSDSEVWLRSNNIRENEFIGIYITVNNTTIWNNTITESAPRMSYGILTPYNKNFNNISYNYIYNLTQSGAIGIQLGSTNNNNSIYYNIINVTQRYNFILDGNGDNNTIYGNYFSQAYGLAVIDGAVLITSGSDYNTFENNVVNGSSLISIAVYLSSTKNVFKNNVFTYGKSIGYDIDNSNYNTITNHITNNSFEFVYHGGSDYLTIANSTVDNGSVGGTCFWPSVCTYTGGIRLSTGSGLTGNNVIIRNISISRVHVGIRMYEASGQPELTNETVDNVNISNVSAGFVLSQPNQGFLGNITIMNSRVVNATGPASSSSLPYWTNTSLIVHKTRNLSVINSTLDNSRFGGLDVNISYDSNVTFLNVTFDKNSVYWGNNDAGDDTSNLTVKWWVDIRVVGGNSSPIPNAAVQARDAFGNLVFSGTTNSNGLIPTQNMTEYVQNRTYSLNFTPYTLTASSGSLTSTVTSAITGARMVSMGNEIIIVLTTSAAGSGSPTGSPNKPATSCVDFNKTVYQVCIDTSLQHRTRINSESIVYKDLESIDAKELTGLVYKYFEINKIGIDDVPIYNATIRFSVNKTWLTENGIDKNNVFLQKYTGSSITGAFLSVLNSLFRITGFASLQIGPWLKNDATIILETDSQINYESSFRDLSTFVVTGDFEKMGLSEGECLIFGFPCIPFILIVTEITLLAISVYYTRKDMKHRKRR